MSTARRSSATQPHAASADRYDVVVLGGGPAGLAAAWELCTAGRRALLVERAPALGGLCATIERDGFRFDLGGHRIISKRHELVDRVRALMGDELLVRERRSVIVLNGARYRYPLVADDLLAQLPWATLARAAADYARQHARTLLPGRAPDVSFRDWVVRRFGQTLYDLFFGPYTEKLWGLSPTELSADWAAQRISLLNLADVGLRLAGLRRGGARTYARRYLYPRRGIGQLFDRVSEEVLARGADVLTDTGVLGLQRAPDGRVCAVALATPAGARTVRCDAVVSTAPLDETAAWLSSRRDDPLVARSAAALRHRGLRFLNITLRGEPVLDATWAYLPDASFTMTRVQEPRARSPEMAPPGHTSLMLEVPADPGDPLWTMSDAALYARLADELTRLGIDVRARTLGYFSSRAPRAYPVYRVGYQRDRDALLGRVADAPNVWTIGRQGLFRYVFMDTAMEMGFAAAREWLGGRRADPARMMAIDSNPTLHEVQSVAA
jgi:protoporphyrinogen oxidase